MDQYIPPVVAVASGMVLVLLCFFMRIPFFIIGVLSIFLVIYALQDHLYRFAVDYKNFSAPDFLTANAPTLIITIVILMSLGFLMLKFGPRSVMTNRPTSVNSSISGTFSPKSSTNRDVNLKRIESLLAAGT